MNKRKARMKIANTYTTGVLLISLAVATKVSNACTVTDSHAKSSSASTLTNRFPLQDQNTFHNREPWEQRGIKIVGKRQLWIDTSMSADECVREGKRCDRDRECCNGNCHDGRCNTSPSLECVGLFDDCHSDKDCCDDDHKCEDDWCCVREGRRCDRDRECCDGNCHNGRCRDCVGLLNDCHSDGDCCDDDHECEDGQCCVREGRRCDRDKECCDGNCDDGRCRDCA